MRSSWLWLLSPLLWLPVSAWSQNVVLSGMLGSKALLVIDGAPPRALAVGEQAQGVRVLSVAREEVLVEMSGVQRHLILGEVPVRLGPAAMTGDNLVLRADSRGHFIERGSIDGHTVQFMVDTGASAVTLSRTDADRLKLRYQGGERVRLHTANGESQGWRIRLSKVRLGDIELAGVQAVVTPTDMPYVLLGNNFLAEFDMTRSGNQMVLRKR